MKTYNITMDDGHYQNVKANSAADAIQSALERHIGHRVTKCAGGNAGEGYYDIPPHNPLTEKPEKRAAKEAKFESDENKKERERPAPWIEEWLASKKPPAI